MTGLKPFFGDILRDRKFDQYLCLLIILISCFPMNQITWRGMTSTLAWHDIKLGLA